MNGVSLKEIAHSTCIQLLLFILIKVILDFSFYNYENGSKRKKYYRKQESKA